MNSENQFNITELQQKKTLTKLEAAFYLGISEQTLTRIIKGGGFYPLTRIGHNRGRVFINREKLDKWFNEQDGSRKSIR